MPATHPEPVANGHDGHSHTTPKKGKSKKTVDSNEASRLLQARISQLEQDAAGEKDQELEIEREVKRATRELTQQISKMNDAHKIDHLIKRSSELLADARRLEKENLKNKKRGDTLQKERDLNRSELSKTIGLKEKLEKLCRELQRDNNKMKNENKELQSLQSRNNASWDEKYSLLLSKLEGYQEDKDTPRKQVVDMEMDELFRVRFKSFIDQYELRELHFHSLMRTKEIELQYHLARFDREKKATEADLAKVRQLEALVHSLSRSEAELRNELNNLILRTGESCTSGKLSDNIVDRQRKEMQDQSKKCKRLEKDNEALRRQKEATAANIIRMAEERQDWKARVEASEKKTAKLMSIIQQMQTQGRTVPGGVTSAAESGRSQGHGAQHEEDSDYSVEAEDGERSDLDDTEDEGSPQPQAHAPSQPSSGLTPSKVPFGPERPPIPPGNAAINGY